MVPRGRFWPAQPAAFDRSTLTKEGFFDNGYFRGLLEAQIAGTGGYSFQLWTVLNAVL